MEAVIPNYQNQLQSTDLQSLINGIFDNLNERSLNAHQNEFFYRYRNHIYKNAVQVCRNSGSNENDNFWAEEITQCTFILALSKLRTKGFQFSETDSETIREYKIKAWIGKIANIEFKRTLSKRFNENIIYDDEKIPEIPFELLDEPTEIEEVPSELKKAFRDVLSILSARDLDIITTYANEGCIKTNLHLSDFQVKRLCDTYQITSINLRKIKNRTIKLIEEKCKFKI